MAAKDYFFNKPNQFTQDQFRGKYDLIYISIPGSFVDLQKLLKNSYSWLDKEGFLVYITSTAGTFDELYTGKFSHFKWLANVKRNTSHLPFSADSSCQLVSSFGFSLVEQKLLQIKIPLDSPDNVRNFAIKSTWAEPLFASNMRVKLPVFNLLIWFNQYLPIAPREVTGRFLVSLYKKPAS